MQINCPYCGTFYDLDDLLLPPGSIKTRCRVCSEIFILNKNTGAVKDESLPVIEPVPDNKPQADDEAGNELSPGVEPAPPKTVPNKLVSDDFMQSIMTEVNGAIAEETDKQENNAGAGAGSKKGSASPHKGKTTPFQFAMLIILIALFLIAAASALIHYNIIDVPFLPANLLSFLRLI
ncbi:MAG: zinc-ribbon domain-containing protein [bacterium]